MAKKTKLVPGTFIRIPLSDGSFGYGRVLPHIHTAFYHFRTLEPCSDLDEIASQPVLFRQVVRFFTHERWVDIGWQALEGEVNEPVVRFWQDVGDYTKCVIYDSTGLEREVAPAQCVGIERGAVWDPPNIEERLLDAFLGRPNEEEIRARVRLRQD